MSKFESLCNEYRENKRLIEELQAMNDNLKSDIIALMGDKESVISGNTKVSNKLIESNKFDSRTFKMDHPDLYKSYCRSSSYRRFTVV